MFSANSRPSRVAQVKVSSPLPLLPSGTLLSSSSLVAPEPITPGKEQ